MGDDRVFLRDWHCLTHAGVDKKEHKAYGGKCQMQFTIRLNAEFSVLKTKRTEM